MSLSSSAPASLSCLQVFCGSWLVPWSSRGLPLGSSALSPADFFQGKHFFLYGEFPGEERRKLSRYVTAFSGELEDYMSDRVQFVITAQEWDPSFEEALMDNPSLVFVRPRWIYSCNEKQKLLPHQLYGVVPQA